MSYARFGEDSDVYVYASVHGGFDCCMCSLNESDSRRFGSTHEIVEHLGEHREAGHKVPERTIPRLLEDARGAGGVDNMSRRGRLVVMTAACMTAGAVCALIGQWFGMVIGYALAFVLLLVIIAVCVPWVEPRSRGGVSHPSRPKEPH